MYKYRDILLYDIVWSYRDKENDVTTEGDQSNENDVTSEGDRSNENDVTAEADQSNENDVTVEAEQSNENELRNLKAPSDLVSCDDQSLVNTTLASLPTDRYTCETFNAHSRSIRLTLCHKPRSWWKFNFIF